VSYIVEETVLTSWRRTDFEKLTIKIGLTYAGAKLGLHTYHSICLGAGESSNSGNVLVQNGCGDSLLMHCDDVIGRLRILPPRDHRGVLGIIHDEGNDIYYRQVLIGPWYSILHHFVVAELKTEKNEGCTKFLSVARSCFKIHVFCSQLNRFLNNGIIMSLSVNCLASYSLPSFYKRNYAKRVSNDCHGLLSSKKGDF